MPGLRGTALITVLALSSHQNNVRFAQADEGSCPETCFSHSCDYWDELVGNQASYCEYAGVDLETTYGCDCDGCDCKTGGGGGGGGGGGPSPTVLPTFFSDGVGTLFPTPTAYSCSADETAFTLILKDSYGDGWNGAKWTWMDSTDGVVATGTLDYGSSKTETLCTSGDTSTGCFSLHVDSGSYPNEISWYIYSRGDDGGVVAQGGGGQTEEVCGIPIDSSGDSCASSDCYGHTCDYWNNLYGQDPNQCDWTAGWDYSMDMCDCSGCDCDKHGATCPTGFTMSPEGSCYAVSEEQHTFTLCQDYSCAVMGGTLASYSSAEEFSYLQDKLGDRYAWVGVYEGGSDESGDWMMVDGSSAGALVWSPGEPNQWCGNNEDCAMMGPANDLSGMLDVSCAIQARCICKYGGTTSSAYESKKSELASTATSDYEDCDDEEEDEELMEKIDQIQEKLISIQNGQEDIKDYIVDEIIEEIDNDVEDSLDEIEDGVEEIEDGMEEIEEGVDEIEEGVDEIEDGIEDMHDGIEEIEDAVEEVANNVEDVQDEVEKVQDTLEDMEDLIQEMNGEADDSTNGQTLSSVDSHLSNGQAQIHTHLDEMDTTLASNAVVASDLQSTLSSLMAITVTSLVVALLALAGVAKLLWSQSATANIPTLASVPVSGGGGPQYNPVHFNDAGV